MTTSYLGADIRNELEKLSATNSNTYIEAAEAELSVCFDFIPSEDHERICRVAKREEMKAEAFKEVMVTFLECINAFAETTNATSSANLTGKTYKNTVEFAKKRFEKLEADLSTLDCPIDF